MNSWGHQPTATLDPAAELLADLRALIASGGGMALLDEVRVRAVVRRMEESFHHMTSIASNPYADPKEPYYASSLQYYRAKYLRDKRCLLSYLLWRQQRITDEWWRSQDNLLRQSLSPAEATYADEYSETMADYMSSFAIPINLRAYMWRPPMRQYLEVRGLKDNFYASPITGNTISIYAGKQILLSFEEAEALIQQKVVELVDH